MNDNNIDGKIDAVQELMVELRKERVELKKREIILTAKKVDFEHLLNPRISSLPADKVAMIVSDYRKLLSERTDVKTAITKLDKVLGLKGEDLSNVPVNISQLKKIYSIRSAKEVFECYSDYLISDVTYQGKELK